MGMKLNQRIALTKELIHRAFIDILKKQSIHKISIRELCELAGINRTTFYNHYGSQYDVLAEIRDQYLNDITEVMDSARSQDKESLFNRVTLVFEYIESNLEISRLLIHNNIDETFAQRLFSLPKIEELLTETLKSAADHTYDKEIVSFAISGGYKLMQDWVSQSNTNHHTAEEMAHLVLRLAEAVCSSNIQ